MKFKVIDIKDINKVFKTNFYKKSEVFTLIWTTTLWTLLLKKQLRVGVGGDIEYVLINVENYYPIVAKEL